MKNNKPMGIVIFNHLTSINFPTFCHARGYGLFSANPLGQYIYQKKRAIKNPEKFELKLEQQESAIFRFRMVIYEGSWNKKQLNEEFDLFCEIN